MRSPEIWFYQDSLIIIARLRAIVNTVFQSRNTDLNLLPKFEFFVSNILYVLINSVQMERRQVQML